MTRGLIGGRGKQRRQNQGDSSPRRTPLRFLTVGVEEGATTPGLRAALEAGKVRAGSPLAPPKEHNPDDT